MSQRPDLPTGLAPGTTVWVLPSPNDARSPSRRGAVEARITKSSRVWIDIESLGSRPVRRWRMRRDTQDEGSQYSGNNARFVTEEQHRWERRRHDALAFLHDQGITIEQRSPWRNQPEILADVLRTASGEQ